MTVYLLRGFLTEKELEHMDKITTKYQQNFEQSFTEVRAHMRSTRACCDFHGTE
jgi:hypothetical protein